MTGQQLGNLAAEEGKDNPIGQPKLTDSATSTLLEASGIAPALPCWNVIGSASPSRSARDAASRSRYGLMSTSMIRLAPVVRRAISRNTTPEPPPTSSTTSPGWIRTRSSTVRTIDR